MSRTASTNIVRSVIFTSTFHTDFFCFDICKLFSAFIYLVICSTQQFTYNFSNICINMYISTFAKFVIMRLLVNTSKSFLCSSINSFHIHLPGLRFSSCCVSLVSNCIYYAVLHITVKGTLLFHSPQYMSCLPPDCYQMQLCILPLEPRTGVRLTHRGTAELCLQAQNY